MSRSLRDLLSLSPCQWRQLDLRLQCRSFSSVSLLPRWLEPRRHLVSSVSLSMRHIDAPADTAACAERLLRALSGSSSVQEVSLWLRRRACLAVPTLDLPALRALSLEASCISLGVEFSQLTALRAATLIGFSLGAPGSLPGIPAAAFPPSLRSLTFRGDYVGHSLPFAVLALANCLEELRWLGICADDEELETLTALRTLCIDGGEFGMPSRVSALTRLEHLSIAAEEIDLEELTTLQNLTCLQVGCSARWGGCGPVPWGEAVLGDVPASLLALPRLKVRQRLHCMP